MQRWILHVDMDEFFAAVEKLDNPELRGKPLLIGGDPKGRGVVATASYEARVFGCHSAMPMSQAVRLCPQAIIIHPRGRRYGDVSEQIFDTLHRFSPLVEPLSIDEAFLDVTGCLRLLGEPADIARQIKQAIRDEVGLTASLGVAPNKFLAKLASDLKKPDGLVVIRPDEIQQVLDPLPVRRLWGCGPAMEKEFARLGIKTIGQVRRMGGETLKRSLGSSGEHFWRLSQGIDDRAVTPGEQAKSIGQEETFARDVGQIGQLRQVLLGQVEEVARRLRRAGLKARTVSLKIRYGDFTTLSRSATLPEITDQTQELWQSAAGLLDAWAAKDFRPLRLLGVSASNLSAQAARQLSLFDSQRDQKQESLDQAVDAINRKFGRKAVRRAGADHTRAEEE